ncbi:MAG: helix-turn-helix domain-containing protein [Firmicutes bacterium]|jgi:hypothetical protein|nr:helix-turn-helix domain-containing protein [Bacillota bacterium]MCL5063741.1 helix-turn-helix domain-containing protein [Bacillota bacterium]
MTDGARTSPIIVEIQRQFDPLAQASQRHVFVKHYTVALESGFLGEISNRDWKTLCVIALHMNAQGRCCPSRNHIARSLGVDTSTASHRIRSLMQFRWRRSSCRSRWRDVSNLAFQQCGPSCSLPGLVS